MKDDIEQHIRGMQENLYKHATDLMNNEEEIFDRLIENLPEELEEEMACDMSIKNHKDIIETIQRRYSYKKRRRPQKTVLNQHRTGRKTSIVDESVDRSTCRRMQ